MNILGISGSFFVKQDLSINVWYKQIGGDIFSEFIHWLLTIDRGNYYNCVFGKRNYRVLVRVCVCVCVSVFVCVCVFLNDNSKTN